MSDEAPVRRSGRLAEVGLLFLRLGAVSFGGPAAHIAMMRDEVARRRRWVSDEEFLDLLGATNLIPGPNSTEMAIHLGYRRAGWAGLVLAGAAFILPAFCIVAGLAWAYVEYGSRPQADWLLYGIKPAVIAIVAHALWALGRAAIRSARLVALVAAVLVLYLLGFNEVPLLLGSGALVLAVRALRASRGSAAGLGAVLAVPAWRLTGAWFVGGAAVAGSATAYSHRELFLVFLKIGSVLYGSGYVLLAFLRTDFVERLGWLTEQQLLDAVAIGQLTPGPVFTTATFVGYLVGSWEGAVIATVGIFLPSFVFVAATHPFIPRIRTSRLASAFLDGVNAAAVALMAGVTLQLGRSAIVDPVTAGLAIAAWGSLLRWRLNLAWLVVGGGLVGLVTRSLS